jgi:uncharacterized SAM-binding protein YcdF (DUF218 family)
MFLFKKIVTPFILPPGLFILVLLLSGVFLIFWHRRKIGIFNLVVGLLFWIFCSAPFSNFLMSGLESEFQIPQNVEGDVIILLGSGSIDNVPDFSGYGIPTDRMFGRIVTAVRLQKDLNIPIRDIILQSLLFITVTRYDSRSITPNLYLYEGIAGGQAMVAVIGKKAQLVAAWPKP